DDDRAAAHAGEAAAIGGSDLAAGVPANADQSTRHLGANPVRGVAADFDGAAFHVRAQVHACIPVDDHAPARHAAADPFHARRVATNRQLVAGLAVDGEKVVNALLTFTQIDGKQPDLLVRQRAHDVGRE